ncbi:zinc ABC transporter substrate-binding protein [Leptolyngbya sp. FACHB-17]|uniref:metal ABC transporter solute-binding protein, Zn/Mn family n=1 Tax=unclassified Leptolyngbya TaxID=2650499 RepID=UPI001681975C|nr:zinc ABC transporter substrate-binding protein [Leptolyngbya sp. FACHB-17]MBD2081197.1 zinc ABC transporter substrate-binding protein [Leptolyngbya sp. FACHB-17]
MRQGWNRRQFGQFIAGGAIALWLHGCGQQEQSTNQKPQVVSTSTILTDLASTIAGDSVQVIGILKPGADPHTYEPVPADTVAMEKANLILYNGYNLEPGLIRLIKAAGVNARQVAVGEVITPLQLEKEGQKVPDPHVWGDVQNVAKMTSVVRDALVQLVPNDREKMTQNADRLIAELNRLDGWIKQQVQTIPAANRLLVTTHDAFQYYGKAYQLAIAGTLIGISTEEQPSAQTVQRLVQSIRSARVPAIFAETTINPALIQTVAQEAGVKLAPQQLYSDSIGAVGSSGETYIKMMAANTTTIVQALGGRVIPFQAG